jgi:zinc protease
MLLKGTESRTNQQIQELIESMGAEVDSQCANNSSFVKAECLSGDFQTIMALLGDVVTHPSFPQAEWGRLQPRLMAAIAKQMDSWNGELSRRFRTIYFGDDANGRYHAWSQGALGRADVVKAATAADLATFYKNHLAAENTIVAVFGDVDAREALAAADRAFGSMPKTAAVKMQIAKPVPPAKASVTSYQTDKQLAAVAIGLGPGISRADKDFAAMSVMTHVVSTFPSGWLETELRGKGPGLVYSVGGFNVTGLVPGYFGVSFNTGTNTVIEALKRSLEVLNRARDTVVDADTLQRAKAGVISDEVFDKQSNDARAQEAALDELYGMPHDESERFMQAINHVTPVDVQRVAKAHLNNPTVVILSNDKVDAAAAQQLIDAFAAHK